MDSQSGPPVQAYLGSISAVDLHCSAQNSLDISMLFDDVMLLVSSY